MDRSLLNRGIIIAVVTILCAIAVWLKGINLGLDLQGGMHLVYEVQTIEAVRAETGIAIDTYRNEAQSLGLVVQIEKTADNAFTVTGVPADRDSEVEDKIVEDFLPDWRSSRSGDRLVLGLSQAAEASIRRSAVSQAQQTIRNRIDQFGVSEPVIEGLGDDRIGLQLPGVDDPERVKDLLKQTALLELRLVVEGTGPAETRAELVASLPNGESSDLEIFPEELRDGQQRKIGEQFWALERASVITGRDLKKAFTTAGEFNEPQVSFRLSSDGGARFGEITGRSIGRGLAIVLDKKVKSVASIRDRISDQGVIHGSFTVQEVQDLVTVLNSGALPASMIVLEERTVGPTLGRDSIDKGLRAGLLGAALVVLTMILVYNFAGFNASLVLMLNLLFIFAGLAVFGATLTLPGIAGIVLTIGMAVDANVLIYERIREEIRDGQTVKSAIQIGFDKAWSAIFDGNLTTLIAAFFLIAFGTGPVRGFAWTLSIGIVGTIFTAVWVSRWVFDLIYSRRQRVDSLSI
jgi:preprotein translocase subunit SecD